MESIKIRKARRGLTGTPLLMASGILLVIYSLSFDLNILLFALSCLPGRAGVDVRTRENNDLSFGESFSTNRFVWHVCLSFTLRDSVVAEQGLADTIVVGIVTVGPGFIWGRRRHSSNGLGCRLSNQEPTLVVFLASVGGYVLNVRGKGMHGCFLSAVWSAE